LYATAQKQPGHVSSVQAALSISGVCKEMDNAAEQLGTWLQQLQTLRAVKAKSSVSSVSSTICAAPSFQALATAARR
jgi:hypothetical protein